MPKKCSSLVFSVMILLLAAAPAIPSIVSITGNIVIVGPPASVITGQYQNNGNIRLFEEQEAIELTSRVWVDIVSPGRYDEPGDLEDDAFLRRDTMVASYLLHADPRNPPQEYQGTVEFDMDILGVIVRRNRLRNTDAMLGAPGTAYPDDSYPSTGLELDPDEDWVRLIDQRTLRVHFTVHNAVDEVRVLTAIPEPGSWLLLASGLLGLGLGQRRRLLR